jgi:hypothetical protein
VIGFPLVEVRSAERVGAPLSRTLARLPGRQVMLRHGGRGLCGTGSLGVGMLFLSDYPPARQRLQLLHRGQCYTNPERVGPTSKSRTRSIAEVIGGHRYVLEVGWC